MQTIMGNNAMMTFGDTYEAPDVQVTEVLVEQGFQVSSEARLNAGVLDYSKSDFDEFAY